MASNERPTNRASVCASEEKENAMDEITLSRYHTTETRVSVEKSIDWLQRCNRTVEHDNRNSSDDYKLQTKSTPNNLDNVYPEEETIASFPKCQENPAFFNGEYRNETESLCVPKGVKPLTAASYCLNENRSSGTLSKDNAMLDTKTQFNQALDNASVKGHTSYSKYFPHDLLPVHNSHTSDAVLSLPAAFFCDPGHLLTASIQEKARVEFFRLSTFAKLDDLVVSPIRLAESGFYYDEELDDIICFSCGVNKRIWSEAESAIAVIHLQLNENCLQANFRDTRNVPFRSDFPAGTSSSSHETREEAQSSNTEITEADGEVMDAHSTHGDSFRESSSNANHDAIERQTRSSTGNPERSSLDAVTTDALGTYQARATHSLSCPSKDGSNVAQSPVGLQASVQTVIHTDLVQRNIGRDTESSIPLETRADASSRNREVLLGSPSASDAHRSPVQPEQAPAATPNNVGLDGSASADGSDRHKIALLDMRRAASAVNSAVSVRLATFIDWPTRGLPLPRSLVISGFYYMGTGDSVRCFYCGVTLRNWRENDDPWETHLRFRFSCDYVTAVKGEDFIIETQVKLATGRCISSTTNEAELNRTGHSIIGDASATQRPNTDSPGNTRTTGSCSSSNIVQSTTSTTSTDAGCTGLLHNGVTSGLPHSQELQTDSEHTASTSTAAPNGPASCLLSGRQAAITTLQTPSPSHTTVSREHPSTSNTNRTITDQDGVTYLQNLQNTNRRLRQRVTCRVCRSRSVDTIFLPCGHLCTCEVCAATITECCLCGDRIRGTAHVYME
ncbi:inhibitor of apoptosis protein-like [Littorina saxatilis]|uniref:inhibitor of apoptosis protein-like n=1 Tax=Littorina saxatilis TaxID=31220 RepID=UPI0038B5E694